MPQTHCLNIMDPDSRLMTTSMILHPNAVLASIPLEVDGGFIGIMHNHIYNYLLFQQLQNVVVVLRLI